MTGQTNGKSRGIRILGAEPDWVSKGLKWSGCNVRIRLWLRLPHGCHRLLSIVSAFRASPGAFGLCSPALAPRCSLALWTTGLCVHPVSKGLKGGGGRLEGSGGGCTDCQRCRFWRELRVHGGRAQPPGLSRSENVWASTPSCHGSAPPPPPGTVPHSTVVPQHVHVGQPIGERCRSPQALHITRPPPSPAGDCMRAPPPQHPTKQQRAATRCAARVVYTYATAPVIPGALWKQPKKGTTVEIGILRRVGPRHLPTRRTSPTRRAPTPCTTLYDASYIPDASGPDALYDTVRRVVQCLKQHSAPPLS